MPATVEAPSIHCMLCPITGPDARQMIEFGDRLHPDPGACEAYAADHGRHLPKPGLHLSEDPLIRRLLATCRLRTLRQLAGAPPAGGLAHAHRARAYLTSMGGHRPVHAQQAASP